MDTVIDNAPCYYFSFGKDRHILAVNTTLSTDLGYTKESLTGHPVDIIFTLSTRIFCETHLFPLLQLQGWANEIFITLQDHNKAHLPVLINARCTDDVTVCIGMLVHNRKKFEAELLETKRTMERSIQQNTELMQAKEELQNRARQLDESLYQLSLQHQELQQFSKVLTHDLQEPLRKLSLFTDLLRLEGQGLDAKTLDAMSRLLNASTQMREVLSGLQQYHWLTAQPREIVPVDLDLVVDQARHRLLGAYPNRTLLLKKTVLPEFHGDPQQLNYLFDQLLDNAMKFTPASQPAEVEITASVVQNNQFRSMDHQYRYRNHLLIKVSDRGTGFDPLFKTDVFELFKKLHSGTGRGLGLAFCKKIVASYSGLIEADSMPDKGTTITILLPLNTPPPLLPDKNE